MRCLDLSESMTLQPLVLLFTYASPPLLNLFLRDASWVYRWVLQGCRWTRRCNSLNWRGWGLELQDVYSEGLHILQKSSVNLLRSIPRNPLRENQRSFCWIPLFLQNVKKRTQNYAYSVSSRIVTDANEIFFERESDRNDFFKPWLANQSLVSSARRLWQPWTRVGTCAWELNTGHPGLFFLDLSTPPTIWEKSAEDDEVE